jgi:hypothetical protein
MTAIPARATRRPPKSSLENPPQQDTGTHRDQQRRDIDQQRSGGGVDMALGLVEEHVVRSEPQHPVGDHAHEVRTPGTSGRAPRAANGVSTAQATATRSRANGPADRSPPTERITTNDDAQAVTVKATAAAATTEPSRVVGPGAVRGEVGGLAAGHGVPTSLAHDDAAVAEHLVHRANRGDVLQGIAVDGPMPGGVIRYPAPFGV